MYRAEYVPNGVLGLLLLLLPLEEEDEDDDDDDDLDFEPFSVEAAVTGEDDECSSEPEEDDEESGAVVACNFTPILPMHERVGDIVTIEPICRCCLCCCCC